MVVMKADLWIRVMPVKIIKTGTGMVIKMVMIVMTMIYVSE